MIVSSIALKNWRNFRSVESPLRSRTYLLGPNASGKSNFLDVFRFLRDVCRTRGGGLQKALADRGGLTSLRSLHARRDPEVLLDLSFAEWDFAPAQWRYVLAFRREGAGQRRTLISREEVWKQGVRLLERPDDGDRKDPARLIQTSLEQIQTNQPFREIADFLGETTYLHLVPQLLKFGDSIGGRELENDPFGQGFLERLAQTPTRTRDARLRQIEKALTLAVPRFQNLRFARDPSTGRPHLEAQYKHHRPFAGWQREDQFSDGTLRLVGLLWNLLDGDSLLLLEEPELSLNEAVVSQIPLMMRNLERDSRRRRQVLVSTHSPALLDNPGIDPQGILLFEPGAEGSTVRGINESERVALEAGLTPAEVLLPKTRPESVAHLSRWP